MKQANIQITFEEEKLRALRRYIATHFPPGQHHVDVENDHVPTSLNGQVVVCCGKITQKYSHITAQRTQNRCGHQIKTGHYLFCDPFRLFLRNRSV